MQIQYILHNEISAEKLLDIIKVKSASWNYSIDEHLQWINKNLVDDDIHTIMFNDENEISAYLNLIKIELIINNERRTGYGIGNVCAFKKGNGDGAKLIKEVNSYLTDRNFVGLLFCKEALIRFYQQFGWMQVQKKVKNIAVIDTMVKTMIFNYDNPIFDLLYEGKSF